MVEKKILVDGLRFSYNGPFDIIEFFKTTEYWIKSNEMEKEIKRKLEHVTPTGKKVEWFIEVWKLHSAYEKGVVRMRALFNNVQEVDVVKNDKKRKLNFGDVLLIFDGFIETNYEGMWHQKPLFYFLRALTDKFVYKFWTGKYHTEIRHDVYNMHMALKEFFTAYK